MQVNCLALFIALALGACNKARNYPDAYVVLKDNKQFIKLSGKRNIMSHDLLSVFENKTYEDSVLVPVQSIGDKTIPGREIIFDNGYNKYSYDGYVFITGNKLSVNLHGTDTVNKTRKQYSYVWNGEYTLHNIPTK